MKILLLGSGGREHALSWKLAQSSHCEKLWIAPGNAGTAQVGENVNISPVDFVAIEAFVAKEGVNMIVVGPEQPLVEGVSDHFKDHDLIVIGPGKEGAQLEGSKAFSKDFMQRHNISTAAYGSFEADQLEEALAFIDQQQAPIVVKASGLAAGKGVLICNNLEEAKVATKKMLSGKSFGEAGRTVVIEEFLDGIEVSVFVLTDGKSAVRFPAAKDYKRIGEGDTGLNTGGMGAVSPVPFANEAFLQRVDQEIIEPTIEGLKKDGIVYQGFIFIGLMVVKERIYVLEYNVRLGDPETQAILPRLDNDLVEMFEAVGKQELDSIEVKRTKEHCAAIILASGGYPGAYEKGKEIFGLEHVEAATIFHAGTRQKGDQVFTNGGRVLAVSSKGDNLPEAMGNALRNVQRIQFQDVYYRRDIGKDLLDWNGRR